MNEAEEKPVGGPQEAGVDASESTAQGQGQAHGAEDAVRRPVRRDARAGPSEVVKREEHRVGSCATAPEIAPRPVPPNGDGATDHARAVEGRVERRRAVSPGPEAGTAVGKRGGTQEPMHGEVACLPEDQEVAPAQLRRREIHAEHRPWRQRGRHAVAEHPDGAQAPGAPQEGHGGVEQGSR